MNQNPNCLQKHNFFYKNQNWILSFHKSIFSSNETNIKIYANQPNTIYIFCPNNSEKISNLLNHYKKYIEKFIDNLCDESTNYKKNVENVYLNTNSKTVLFLGKSYQLFFIESIFNGCVLGSESLKIFYKKNKNPMKVLKEYFIKELDSFIRPLYHKYVMKVNIIPIEEVPMKIKFSRRWWGRCSSKYNEKYKKIMPYNVEFNVGLILLDPKYIETVVVHEISHFLHRHHRKEFKLFGELLYEDFIKNDSHINDKIYYLNFN